MSQVYGRGRKPFVEHERDWTNACLEAMITAGLLIVAELVGRFASS